MRRSRTLALAGVACIALAVGCGKKDQAPAPPPPELGVLEMRPESTPLTRNLVGRLSAYRTSDVRARVAGVLLKRVYREGSEVKEGQTLFQIDPAPLQAALNASLAALAQAEATYTNNHIAAQRTRNLAPKGFVSRSDVDNAEAAERTAAAAVKQSKANVDSARINLGYADVRAPISGRAGKQQVTEGALVGQADATLLTTVDQLDPLYINFTMSVSDLEDLRRAKAAGRATLSDPDKAEVQVVMPDGRAYGKTGLLDFSDTSVDPATGAVSLRGQVPNPDSALLPGMYVTITVTLGEQHDVFKVPQPALQRDAKGPFELVVGADGNVARKDVVADTARDGYWIISSGLAAGDKVVVSGVQRAKSGQPAKAVPWKPDADANAPAAAPATGTKPAQDSAPASDKQ